MVGSTLVSKISPIAGFAGPGWPTLVVHGCASPSRASLFAGCDLNGSLFTHPGSADAALVLGNAGKSYSCDWSTDWCAAATRSSRNCLHLSTFFAHLGMM